MAKKKLSGFKKFCIIGGSLIAIQLISLTLLRRSNAPKDFKAAMKDALSEVEKTKNSDQVMYAKIQLALGDYRIKKGGYPEGLGDLVPEYFDNEPVSPTSGQPFPYKINEDFYDLGLPSATAAYATNKTTESIEEHDVLALLNRSSLIEDYVYDPRGKRDPFKPYDFTPRFAQKGSGTELEKYPYESMRIAAILKNDDDPKAIIEAPDGKGYTASIGSPIGIQGGKIISIEADKILVLESIVDFTGEKQTRTIELFLR